MEPENTNQSNPSVTQEVTSSLVYETPTDDRLYTVLYKKIEELSNEVHDLKTKKVLDETQMPPELLENAGLLPQPKKKWKRGRGFRPLLRSEIEDAQKQSIFCSEQAKYLGIGIATYRKYCLQYGIWNPTNHAKGRKCPWHPEKGKYPLSKILAGEMNSDPRVTDWLVRPKLLRAGTFPEECAQCGYNKKHIVNGRVPLLIDHMDGDVHNFKKENLRLLCWNCTIECGRGYLRRGIHKFDPDWRTEQA